MAKRRHIKRRYLPHEVTVEKQRRGTGGVTEWVSTGGPVPCMYSGKRRLVRDGDGEQVVASATVITQMAFEDRFAPGYRVALPGGRTTTVIDAIPHDDGGVAGAWCHLEVVCE